MEMLQTTLREPRNGVDTKWFIREILEGNRKSPGWIQMTMCKYPVARQVLTLVANVPNSNEAIKRGKKTITEALGSPRIYSDAFHQQVVQLAEEGQEKQEDDGNGLSFESSDMDWERLTAGMPKCLTKFAEILVGLYGEEFDAEMKALAGEKSPKDTLMDDAELAGVSATLRKKLHEGLRLVAAQTNEFTACEGQQEAVSMRSLKRDASNPDEAEVAAANKERSLLWEKAREQRRKYVALSQLSKATKAKIDAALARVPQGSLETARRLFVWSADLVTESSKTPWKEASPPKAASCDAVLDCIAKRSGPGDFAICFDGRMRDQRASLEKKLEAGGKSPEELFVFYAADGAVAGNKVFMGAKLHEVAYALLPCKRQRMTVEDRKDKFLPKGADSTHCSTFANVPLPRVTELPRVSPLEKAIVFPEQSSGEPLRAACPQKWDYGGVPMYWRESKTQQFWEAILKMFQAKVVVDFTPGSGALACAAMSHGAKYTGFVEESKHLAWLQNIVDAASLRYIAKVGEALYMEDVAELINQHYQDLVENDAGTKKPDLEWLSDSAGEED